jgi:hypothetical protein
MTIGPSRDQLASPAGPEGTADGFWERVGAIADDAADVDMLALHGVVLIAAWRARALGRPVSGEVQEIERTAHAIALCTPVLLQRIRGSLDAPLILMKGPELADRYPEESRSFGDIDLLVPDPASAQRALIDVGFVEVDDPELYLDIHHLRPLMWRSLPLKVELHKHPKWPDGFDPPPFEELLAAAGPARSHSEYLTLSPAHHAIAVAAHAWAHVPLRSLRDFIDVAVLARGLDRREAQAVADRWGIGKIWRTTIEVTDALFEPGAKRSIPLRLWGRHLREVRDRTVAEAHLEQMLSPFWAMPARRAARLSVTNFLHTFRRAEGDSWGAKLRRSSLALRHAFRPRSAHDDALGESANRWRRSRRD